MKEIRIAHLYYDILNLYGDNGNIKALKLELENAGLDVTVDEITLGDTFDPSAYHLIYIGPGSENGQRMIIPDILKYRDAIRDSIDKENLWLVTGNSLNLFGKSITYDDGKTFDTLGIFGYTALPLHKRIAEECVMQMEGIKRPVIGIQIRTTKADASPYPLFEVIRSTEKSSENKPEGVRYKGFYGTCVTGPLLPRNPDFLRHMIERVVHKAYPDYPLVMPALKENDDAYEAFMDNFFKDLKI